MKNEGGDKEGRKTSLTEFEAEMGMIWFMVSTLNCILTNLEDQSCRVFL